MQKRMACASRCNTGAPCVRCGMRLRWVYSVRCLDASRSLRTELFSWTRPCDDRELAISRCILFFEQLRARRRPVYRLSLRQIVLVAALSAVVATAGTLVATVFLAGTSMAGNSALR